MKRIFSYLFLIPLIPSAVVFIVGVFFLVSASVRGTTLVLPNYAETNQSSGGGHTFLDISREQTVYNASELPPYPIVVTEIRWRPDVFTGGPVTATVSNIQVNLSTATNAADQLNSNFAANTGVDDTVVFSGVLNINSSFTDLPNGTKAFDIDMPLQTPFTFDATKGNLLIDVRNFTGSPTAIYDNVVGGTDGTSRAYNTSDPNASDANRSDSGGSVVQIVFARVASPPTIDSQPTNLTVGVNDNATFTVVASGVPPLGCQWFFEDLAHPVDGATNTSITLTNVQSNQAGHYFVEITNGFGLAFSSSVLLTVTLQPLILSQPVNQIVSPSDSANFSVSVESSVPVAYQWLFNATNLIAGATNASLMFTNVQASQAGIYSVQVSNVYASMTSSNAGLLIGVVAPNYATNSQSVSAEHLFIESVREQIVYGAAEFPPYPIVIREIRWRPDTFGSQVTNDTMTNIQLNLSTTTNGAGTLSATFVQNTGVDATVVFDGQLSLSTSLTVLNNGTTAFDLNVPLQNPFVFDPSKGNLLLEVRNFSGGTAILYDNSTTGGSDTVSRVFSSDPNGTTAGVSDTGGGVIQVGYIPAPLPPTISPQPTNRTATVGSDTTFAVTAGPPPVAYQWFFGDTNNPIVGATNGSLTLTNLQGGQSGIYLVQATGAYGTTTSSNALLIVTADPPAFTSQPASRSVLVGNNTTFSASAVGSLPLTYQWYFNASTLIVGATNASLTLTNVQLANAGTYSLWVTNAYGSTNTTNALLTLNFPPVVVRLGTTNVMGGNSFDVPILLVANGVENTLDFSMNFNTQLLAYANVALGSNALDASLLLNTVQAVNGRLGITLQLPSGEMFTAGTQEVARVTFNSSLLSGTQPVVTPVNFTNQPINKLLFDVLGNKMATNFINGSVTISVSDLEGDVIPRTTGDRSLDIFDWNEVGRMVAGLDVVSNAAEFQRVDCAPKSTSGDGQLKVTDWVQAGRYGSATDLPAVVGGPTALVSPTVLTGGPRAMNISAGTTAKGIAVTLPVILQSQGDESALGFSVNFNPTVLKYVSIAKGSAATSSTLMVNTNQAASGTVGVLIALSSGNFATGAQEVVRLNFTGLATVTNNAVTFADQPVIRAISDSAANELAANYTNSSVTINPPPTLSIIFTNGSTTLSWPSWATGFNLQGSLDDLLVPGWTNVSSATQTNGGNISVTVPATQGGYFRLQHP